MLNLGLLGSGRIVQLVHLEALTALPGVRVGAIAERDPKRRQEAGQRVPQARLFDDYRTLIASAEVDAVVICLPPALHAKAALQAFEAGLHVYLEKPIATNLKEAHAVVEAGRRAGTVGMMGFNYRFGALHQEARALLKAGEVGELVGGRTVFSTANRKLPAWKTARQSGGGVLLDLASHHVDLVHFLFEREVTSVSAQLLSQQSEHDGAAIQLHLSSGVSVQSLFMFRSVMEDRFEIYGRRGKLSFDRHTSAGVKITSASFEYGRLAQLKREGRRLVRSMRRVLRAPGEPSYQVALSAFAEAVAERRSNYPRLEEGYRSLAVLAAAEQAADRRQPVEVPQLSTTAL